jgi:hypothetical protein
MYYTLSQSVAINYIIALSKLDPLVQRFRRNSLLQVGEEMARLRESFC